MSVRKLPAIKAFERPEGLAWDAPSDALARWHGPAPEAAAGTDEGTVTIYDVIGEDSWTGNGFTAKRMSAALRSIGARDVTVKINSPGGDFFEGVAIYNLLREHPAAVTVRVMGLAASAASIIAMAGDRIEMGRGAFLMIHNAWAVAIGNRHDMRAAADTLEPFDAAMAGIYEHRSGLAAKKVAELMDAETWLAAAQAVEMKFADAVIDDEATTDGSTSARADLAAKHRVDTILAKQGMPRSERRRLIRDLANGTPGAAEPAMPSAGDSDPAFADLVRKAIATLRS